MLSEATADPSAARQDDSVSDGEAGVCEVAAGGARSAVLDGWSPIRKLLCSQPHRDGRSWANPGVPFLAPKSAFETKPPPAESLQGILAEFGPVSADGMLQPLKRADG